MGDVYLLDVTNAINITLYINILSYRDTNIAKVNTINNIKPENECVSTNEQKGKLLATTHIMLKAKMTNLYEREN